MLCQFSSGLFMLGQVRSY